MSSQIPPLVCHTPPPIDFDADDDDDDYGSDIPEDDVIGIDERNRPDCLDDDFGDFATVLPPPAGTTNHLEPIPTEAAVIDNETEALTNIPVAAAAAAETKGIFPPRLGSDSPPSLILPPNDYTEAGDEETAGNGGVVVIDDDEDIDFQPFGSPSQPPEPPPEDSISLPSLHFDADVSKSEEDDNLPPAQQQQQHQHQHHQAPNATSSASSVSGIETEVDLPLAAAAERTTPVIQEGGRFDDNTENDFTDFTTASNERSSVVLEVPTANDVSFELDDFAQLESTPSADSNFVSQQSRADFATFDADFSKFDSFQASFPATIDDPVPVKTPVEETKSMPIMEQAGVTASELAEDDFDDFQEFATFSDQPVVATASAHSGEKSEPEPDRPEAASSLASSTSTVENERKDVETQLAAAINAATVVSEHQHEDDNVGDDGDDDFGEFSDFKQPEATVSAPALSTATSLPTFSMESVQKLLEAMFPSAVPEPVGTGTGQQAVAANHIPTSKLHTQLQDFDNTSALAYQYSKSSSSKTLVTALGIDSRNIMYGPKWNSSMPRFAANLSFNPLEPLKPATAPGAASVSAKEAGSSEKSANCPPASKPVAPSSLSIALDPLQVATVGSASVPAAQFDWNSSGLVNPLEGVQEMLQKATTGQPEDGPKGEVLDPQIAENASPAAADDIAVKGSALSFNAAASHPAEFEDIGSLDFNPTGSSSSSSTSNGSSNNSSNNAQYSVASMPQEQLPEQIEPVQTHPYVPAQQQQQQQQQPPLSISSSPNSVPVVRTIKLPETHIFTPSRGVTPISRDITDRDIVVREYHDVEYSLEKPTASSMGVSSSGMRKECEFDEFNDFQSVPVAVPSVFPETVAISTIGSAARPVIGRSPTEELERYRPDPIGQANSGSRTAADLTIDDGDEDDEFSDFQAAVPPMVPTAAQPPVNKPISSVQSNRSVTSSPVMLLSPAILLPQQANTTMEKESANARQAASINWPDPGVDPDELARFEAAFAKPNASVAVAPPAPTVASSNQSVPSGPKPPAAVEEDEWTDFISSKPAAGSDMRQQQAASLPAGPGPAVVSETQATTQEEWTDFMSSSTTTAGSGYPPQSRLSSSQNNFNYPRTLPAVVGGAATKGAGSSSSSWANQPQLPPPQFSSWNSNSLYYNPMASLPLTNQQQTSQYRLPPQQYYNRTDMPAMVYAGGAGYSGSPKVPTNPQQQHHHHHQQHSGMPTTMMMGQQQQPPMQLLPELSFITPNATGHGSAGTPGTKPATHSFLSNVISSNSFTKK
ncbi:mucin-6 isoform X2 [Anopheles gambiae]|uniref:mucin-6 isoform X2 n=1 Tax=Anopheles gambiae TaxID=7165 RepID=UPI002AC95F77|nr:mucin-6 isoform X2 [Anopheles gambiae]XP_061501846.1 mucin-6 isoform X2 [Anopheles gambiae]